MSSIETTPADVEKFLNELLAETWFAESSYAAEASVLYERLKAARVRTPTEPEAIPADVLEPCPFCGVRLERGMHKRRNRDGSFAYMCAHPDVEPRCVASSVVVWAGERESEDAWNRRASRAPVDAEMALAMRQKLDEIKQQNEVNIEYARQEHPKDNPLPPLFEVLAGHISDRLNEAYALLSKHGGDR